MVKSIFNKAVLVAVTLVNFSAINVFATHDTGRGPVFTEPPNPRHSPPPGSDFNLRRPRPTRPFPGEPTRPPFRPPNPPPRFDLGCTNQYVDLYCKVNGHHMYVSGYTDCGYTPHGSYCNFVETPGYFQRKMRVQFQCLYNEMNWTLGGDGYCSVTTF